MLYKAVNPWSHEQVIYEVVTKSGEEPLDMSRSDFTAIVWRCWYEVLYKIL